MFLKIANDPNLRIISPLKKSFYWAIVQIDSTKSLCPSAISNFILPSCFYFFRVWGRTEMTSRSGRGGQGFCDNSNEALVIKSVTMGVGDQ
jgi:hypothetical protein